MLGRTDFICHFLKTLAAGQSPEAFFTQQMKTGNLAIDFG
jgi:hypothetical protein